jgi:hypothetical protein
MAIKKVIGKGYQSHTRMTVRRPLRVVAVGLSLLWLTACVASQAKGPVGHQPAYDRILLAGDIQVAEARLRDFGFDPGPVDGIYTA